MPIGLFTGILIEYTTWTTRKCDREEEEEKKRTKRFQFTTCTKSMCRIKWLSLRFDISQKICFSWFRFFFVPHQFTFFSLSIALSATFSLFSVPFVPHFTLFFHHINIFQSHNTHTLSYYIQNIDSSRERESVWHWR